MKAVQQTLMDNQQVILQSLHQNQTNIDRLGICIISVILKSDIIEFGCSRSDRIDVGRFNDEIHNAHAPYHVTRR